MLIEVLAPLGEHLLNNGFEKTHDFLKRIFKTFYEKNKQRNFNKINGSDMNLLFTYVAYTNQQLMKDLSEYIKSRNINLKTPKKKKNSMTIF